MTDLHRARTVRPDTRRGRHAAVWGVLVVTLVATSCTGQALSRRKPRWGTRTTTTTTWVPRNPTTTSTTTTSTTTTAAPAPTAPTTNTADDAGWKRLQLGAGGWVNGIDLSDDGSTVVVRTDTAGGYRWDAAAARWTQLVTAASMPVEDRNTEISSGVWELLVAPSLPTRLYMAYGGAVYRSDDRGDHWTKTSRRLTLDANDPARNSGGRMAVDPADPDTVYLGTTDGLWRTTDGGTSWAKVAESSVPKGTTTDGSAMTGIAFDRTSGTVGGRTRTVWVGVRGRGTYRSTDGGTTWANTGGPSATEHQVVGPTGVVFATSAGRLWRYQAAAWKDVSPNSRWWHSVAVDPANANRVLVSDDGGDVVQSADGGATWPYDAGNNVTRRATDIPWLAWTTEDYMSNGRMVFDPKVPNKVWFSQGIGVWTTSLAPTATSVTWTSQSLGIDQLLVSEITDTPGDVPLVGTWDRATFRIENPDAFPTKHSPSPRFNSTWSLDYASTDPRFVVATTTDHRMCCPGDGFEQQSAWSADAGRTWSRFSSMPGGATRADQYGFGSIAVSTPDNWVWVPSRSKLPYVTKDRGATWQPVSLPGLDPTNQSQMEGFGWAYYLNRHNVVADSVVPGTFWIYNSILGLYRSTDGGTTWSLVRPGQVTDWSYYHFKMKAVPGRAGHLFATSGTLDGGVIGAFRRSRDGGVTWTDVPGVMEVHAFGFGKAAPGATAPAIFVVGWVNGVYGIYESYDDAVSWNRIGTFPQGSLSEITAVEGDQDVVGRVYVGTGGNGAFYRG